MLVLVPYYLHSHHALPFTLYFLLTHLFIFALTYVSSLANVFTIIDPNCYSKAIKHQEQVDAIQKELDALGKNDT